MSLPPTSRLALATLILSAACTNASTVPHAQASAALTEAKPSAGSGLSSREQHPTTALLSLALYPDGTGRLLEGRVRPIPFTRYAAPHQAPRGDESWVLIATSAAGSAEIPLDLGSTQDPGGDVISQFRAGGTILRAPYFGARTRYVIRRRNGPPLAELEVGER